MARSKFWDREVPPIVTDFTVPIDVHTINPDGKLNGHVRGRIVSVMKSVHGHAVQVKYQTALADGAFAPFVWVSLSGVQRGLYPEDARKIERAPHPTRLQAQAQYL